MKRNRLLTIVFILFAFLGIQAEGLDDGLKLHFDFSQVSGGMVPDAVAGGTVSATLCNNARIVKAGKYSVLDLGTSNGYLDMSAQAGKALKECTDWSASVYYFVNSGQDISGSGNFLYSFSSNAACDASSGQYCAYRINVQRYATSTGGYGNETGLEVGSASAKGRWVNVVFVQKGTTGTLYIDGVEKGTVEKMPLLKDLFTTEEPLYCWIGRSPFSADLYLANTLVADFRLYSRALEPKEITRLALVTNDIEQEYFHGEQGDLSALSEVVSETQRQLSADLSDYPADAVVVLEDVYQKVKGKAEQETLAQVAIDAYTSELQTALNAFLATRGFVFTDNSQSSLYDVNRGFRHPGGLHTDADFERIRKQLAEGNERVTKAYNILKSAEYAQPTCAIWPVETVIRGEGAQNYINAARGASIAYQNALRWKIEDNKDCAQYAVNVLNQWADVCKGIGGNSNYALAAGLYGYEFAQAAELMRCYEGWKTKDFEKFKRWMLDVWYPSAVGFLRGRNGTWENAGNKPNAGWGTAGDRPGHYWSNWGLCNALCLESIGILCDDVFIYNQGLSFVKYDLAALTGSNPAQKRTDTDIWNNGITEYIDNLIPNVAEYDAETGAYGKVGQMQESGRDQGHATMALGLAVDICQIAWNQGDDLFAYHDNRMAAGIEFTAALNNAGKTDLPWVTYHYADCRTAWHNAWNQETPAWGSQTRPYWARVIGHYEGVKGIKMPFAEKALEDMGIDGGPSGGTSGAYDHMGYSVLTCTYDSLAPVNQRPTQLSPRMEYEGEIIDHNELGGLKSTYLVNTNMGVPTGREVTLEPQLPEGEEDTGMWQWNTGEKSRKITVPTDKSYLYRATYTNNYGVESQQMFAIAVQGDCTPNTLSGTIYCDGTQVGTTEATVYYGASVDLNIGATGGWGEVEWSTGEKSTTLHISALTADRVVKGNWISQGGRKQTVTFNLYVKGFQPQVLRNNRLVTDSLCFVVTPNESLVLSAKVPNDLVGIKYEWSNGRIGRYLALGGDSLSTADYTLHITGQGVDETLQYKVLVAADEMKTLPDGKYAILDVDNDTWLTYEDGDTNCHFLAKKTTMENMYDASQVWTFISHVAGKVTKYNFSSLSGGSTPYLNATGLMAAKTYWPFSILGLIGSDRVALRTMNKEEYWQVGEDNVLYPKGMSGLKEFAFLIVPVNDAQVITVVDAILAGGNEKTAEYYTTEGVRVNRLNLRPGIYITRLVDGTRNLVSRKVVVK